MKNYFHIVNNDKLVSIYKYSPFNIKSNNYEYRLATTFSTDVALFFVFSPSVVGPLMMFLWQSLMWQLMSSSICCTRSLFTKWYNVRQWRSYMYRGITYGLSCYCAIINTIMVIIQLCFSSVKIYIGIVCQQHHFCFARCVYFYST